MSKILVTGGTGFVGSRLIPFLVSRGHVVFATYHTTPHFKIESKSSAVTWVEHELSASLAGQAWFDSIDVIVHLAGLAHKAGKGAPAYDAIYKANVIGTEQLTRDAIRHAVKNFVFVSTVKVHGEYTGQDNAQVFSEDSPYNPVDDYAKCKTEAEKVLIEAYDCAELNYTILRPPLVYGPGVKANFLKLIKLADSGLPLPLGSLSQKRSMIFVDNLIDAITECVSIDQAHKQALVLKDIDITIPDLMTALAKALGKSSYLFPFPERLLEICCTLIGKHSHYEKIAYELLVNDTNSRRLLTWQPRFSFEEGVAKTVDWYRQQ